MNKEGGFRFHDTRATAKTNMLQAGVDKALRDVILGYRGWTPSISSPLMTIYVAQWIKYTLWLGDQIEQGVANLDQSLDQIQEKGLTL